MFGTEWLIKTIVSMLGEYLILPTKAAKYAKWFIRARNYLNLLFPVEKYPVDWQGTNISEDQPDLYEVPVEAVKRAANEKGFNLPFIRGV